MKFYHFLWISILLLLMSCGNQQLAKQFTLSVDQPKAKYKLGDTIKIHLKTKKAVEFQSITYHFQNKTYDTTSKNADLEIPTDQLLLGKYQLKAKIQVGEESVEIDKWVKIYNHQKPKLYTFEIINTYPHNQSSYTQGLEFYQDTLYEGTGKRGSSKLMKVNYKTGETYNYTRLNDRFFGEGITILNHQVYQLTWQSNIGFIYNPQNLEKKRSFSYDKSKEGWGICNDGEYLYKSDGTPKIWRLDPETTEELDFIQPTTNARIADELNELEWIKGKIYANMYQKDGVLIIDPSNGAVDGVIDFRALKEKVDINSPESVLNGIAYKPDADQLFVTGKNWDKLFEVKIVPKNK
ncbi:MAG: glutaminyl-peptide cyclotransferase [Psychroflexus sp.]|nr:glutaminyl-peptide cyclotransferase [Psychroflexus sp.]MDR9448198.1 glutaminyl-peptide cyclotransferase [Psychroflexus sp.]